MHSNKDTKIIREPSLILILNEHEFLNSIEIISKSTKLIECRNILLKNFDEKWSGLKCFLIC